MEHCFDQDRSAPGAIISSECCANNMWLRRLTAKTLSQVSAVSWTSGSPFKSSPLNHSNLLSIPFRAPLIE
jgi:hypothetical protein